MKYFLDTEFIERGAGLPIELISLAIVSEDGRELYSISEQFDYGHANQWVKDNVLPHIGNGAKLSNEHLSERIRAFVAGDHRPVFWGYYADYDWVVFCQIFGAMIDLPKGWPMYCRDLKQWCDDLGNPKLPAQDSTEHNALNDARWNRKVFDFLSNRQAMVA